MPYYIKVSLSSLQWIQLWFGRNCETWRAAVGQEKGLGDNCIMSIYICQYMFNTICLTLYV